MVNNKNMALTMTKTFLWLDDLRNPFLGTWIKPEYSDHRIIWVLNYDQFVEWIKANGLPNIISFDHDLADEHYTPEKYWNDYDRSKEYQDSKTYTEKTGHECAKWLVNYCQSHGLDLPNYLVHSFNPVGADNIRGILESYKKFINNQDHIWSIIEDGIK